MIFHSTRSPRLLVDQNFLEITHKVVVDDDDMTILSLKEIESYFPALQPGFRRANVFQGHHDQDKQTLFLVIDEEIGAIHGS